MYMCVYIYIYICIHVYIPMPYFPPLWDALKLIPVTWVSGSLTGLDSHHGPACHRHNHGSAKFQDREPIESH